MTAKTLQFDELSSLLSALCDGTIDAQGFARLESSLADNPAARRWYIAYMDLHGDLCWNHSAVSGEGRGEGGEGSGFRGQEEVAGGQWPVASGQNLGHSSPQPLASSPSSNPPSLIPNPSFIPPIIIAPTAPSVALFSLSSPLGSYLFSYSASAVLLCIALFLGGIFKMSAFQASDPHGTYPKPEVTIAPSTEKLTPVVARITGRFECRLADATHTSDVRLGKKFKLAAGFLELTYDTGAKVILQGPCVYRVSSPRGGFLEVGKLTAHVGARGMGRGAGGVASGQWSVASESRASNPQSLIPNPSSPSSLAPRPSPLFTVTTPAAIVTDLGTEFGVEVEKSGTTRSHVFKGRVQVRNSNSRGPTARGGDSAVIELTANQSASVQAGNEGTIKLTRNATGWPSVFVRTMPQARPTGLRPAANIGDRPGDMAGFGENVTYACAVDAAGKMIKHSPTVAGTAHIFFSDPEGLLDVGTLQPGESFSMRRAWAGWLALMSNGNVRTLLHVPGKGMKDIGTLGGPRCKATRVGPAGQVVGWSATPEGFLHAFVYSDGKMQDLGTLGGPMSYASDINAAGQIVGDAHTADGILHAFIYTPGVGMKDLGALFGDPKTSSWALCIDDAGQVSGCTRALDGRRRAFRWNAKEGMRDLGAIGDDIQVAVCRNGQMRISRLSGSPVYPAKDRRPGSATGEWPKPLVDLPDGKEKPPSLSPDAREKRRTSP